MRVTGRVIFNDAATRVVACVAGLGVAQIMELSIRELVTDGSLVELFPRWGEELFPLYVYYPSRHLPPARVRAFVDLVVASAR